MCVPELQRATRYDVGRLDKFERTAGGGLRIPASVSRIGIQVYQDADGNTIRELRPPEEVFDAASVASIEDAPVTDLHPDGMVDPSNWARLAKGTARAPRVNGDHVEATLVLHDADEIRRVESGERVEVSLGYEVDLDPTPGEWQGEKYDAVQRRIRANHVALGPVGWGRAGPTVALRLDAREKTMKTIKIDGFELEVGSDAHAQATAKVLEERDGARRELDEARGRLDAVTQERDEARARADKAWSKDEVASRVDARLALIDRARRVLGAEYEHADKDNREVMTDALAKAGRGIAEDASDDYLRGAFEAVTDAAEGGGESEETQDGRGDSHGVRIDRSPATTRAPMQGIVHRSYGDKMRSITSERN